MGPSVKFVSPNKGLISKKTSQELGNCPMGQREALLKERLYWKKGFFERKALLKKRLFKKNAFLKNCEIIQNCENKWKLWNLVKIQNNCQNCELW